ncbi:tail fiber domain-containing protein [Yeosuana marina]|uniref:tail fiber domain-containing protein n=1 Tax=Yeosuana marina TaxID=1565536 RepID=UPI00141FDA45|nr:tail fiber domain-containing protein [Yeosuana marina]
MKTFTITIKKSFIAIAVLLSLQNVLAQSPQKMSYQAVIRNASNTLISNTNVSMRVSILQGTSAGTEVFKETFNATPTNINGLVTIEIGTGTPVTGTFSGINWANGPYFIKTETDPNGGSTYTITGTSQLMSVPYALYAASSGTSGVSGWNLTGNGGTNINSDFIGTTDAVDVIFKRNNAFSGLIGDTNAAFGNFALSSNNGAYNTAIGAQAMFSNTTGLGNIANGYAALYSNTTGSENVANGFSALYSNTIGIDNTANGYLALYSNTIGSNNTANGVNALRYNTTGDGNTATGSGAMVINSTGVYNTANGVQALYSNSTGSYNTAVGHIALNNNTGSNNIGIGYDARVPSATGSNQVRIGNTAITYAGIQVAWTITSDKRLKDNIKESALGLNFINALNPVSYTRRNDENKKVEYGFIAQEVEEVLKKNNVSNSGIITVDDQKMYSMRYNDIIAPLVKAIQEQQVLIDTLTKRIEVLEKL